MVPNIIKRENFEVHDVKKVENGWTREVTVLCHFCNWVNWILHFMTVKYNNKFHKEIRDCDHYFEIIWYKLANQWNEVSLSWGLSSTILYDSETGDT